jgi:membrane fusion protein (multidrug efflux system)
MNLPIAMTSKISFRLIAGLSVAAALVAAVWILNRPESTSRLQTTDDAYVRADFTVVAPQVAGRIQRVLVSDHQAVKAGEVLVQLDDRDLRIAVQDATARAAGARAVVAALQAQLARQRSLIGQAQASVSADDANLHLARLNLDRFTNLARDGSGTLQAQQQADAQWQVLRATRDRDQATVLATRQQQDVLRAEIDKARAEEAVAIARLADAELKLSYARVVAPSDGVIDQRGARDGGYVRVGDPLLTLVPTHGVYVEANFRETQLAHLRPGQAVRLRVDALPGVALTGRVETLAPASGVSFSAVAPHNATGNFTKIVQRLPVRIRLDEGQAALSRLRVGMSVEPRIETDGPDEPRLADAGRR